MRHASSHSFYLEVSGVVISRLLSPLIWVISIVTLLITLLTTTPEPPSTKKTTRSPTNNWVVVKIMVPFWVPNIIRHLLLGYPKRTIILTTTHVVWVPFAL